MKNIDWNNVEEAREFEVITAGGYVAKIIEVEDYPEKEYLKIEFDIAEGKFKGYYTDLFNAKNFWGGSFIRSYKEKAQSFFKGFITAVQNSNKGFVFDNNEKKLVGKFVGIILREEEYMSNLGEKKTRLKVDSVCSVDRIKKGDYKVPQIKKLAVDDGFVPVVSDDDLPF